MFSLEWQRSARDFLSSGAVGALMDTRQRRAGSWDSASFNPLLEMRQKLGQLVTAGLLLEVGTEELKQLLNLEDIVKPVSAKQVGLLCILRFIRFYKAHCNVVK